MTPLFVYYLSRILMMVAYAGAIGDVFSTNLALRAGARESFWISQLEMRFLKSKWVLARLSLALASLVGILLKPEYRDSWISVGAFFAQTAINWYAVINNILVIKKQKLTQ